MELLNNENLIEVHEKLNEFAVHHQGIGRKDAFKLVKKIRGQWGESPSEATEEARLKNEWYDRAVSDILRLLQDFAF